MEQIFVLTHNGLPPSQGGLRVAYRVRDLIFPLGSTIPQRLPAPPKPLVKYGSLPYPLDSDGTCPGCLAWPNSKRRQVETDVGVKEVISCHHCGKLMRPHGGWR